MIGNLFNLILTRPFGYILMSIYKLTKSYGLSIIIFSIITRMILLIFSIKGKKNSRKLIELQNKTKIIQLEHKNDIKLQQKLIGELYKNEGVNVISGIIPMLLTLPIIFAVFKVIQNPLKFILGFNQELINKIMFQLGIYSSNKISFSELDLVNIIYDNIPKLKNCLQLNSLIDFNFLGMNLLHIPSLTKINLLLIIPILSGITTYILQKITQLNKKPEFSLANFSSIFFSMVSIWLSFTLPAGLGLYWIIGNIFSIFQEYFFNKKMIKKNHE